MNEDEIADGEIIRWLASEHSVRGWMRCTAQCTEHSLKSCNEPPITITCQYPCGILTAVVVTLGDRTRTLYPVEHLARRLERAVHAAIGQTLAAR